jgi:hypothetical protein
MKRFRPRLALIGILCYELKALAILSFILMLFCISKGLQPNEYGWWMHATKTGFAWIILWALANFIDIKKDND